MDKVAAQPGQFLGDVRTIRVIDNLPKQTVIVHIGHVDLSVLQSFDQSLPVVFQHVRGAPGHPLDDAAQLAQALGQVPGKVGSLFLAHRQQPLERLGKRTLYWWTKYPGIERWLRGFHHTGQAQEAVQREVVRDLQRLGQLGKFPPVHLGLGLVDGNGRSEVHAGTLQSHPAADSAPGNRGEDQVAQVGLDGLQLRRDTQRHLGLFAVHRVQLDRNARAFSRAFTPPVTGH